MIDVLPKPVASPLAQARRPKRDDRDVREWLRRDLAARHDAVLREELPQELRELLARFEV